jgi:transposase
MNAALAYRADGSPLRLCFEILQGTYNQHNFIAFLRKLCHEFRGRRILLLWDGLRAHRTVAVTTFIDQQRGRLKVVRLPPYAPELNPTEYLWAHLKNGVLANAVPPSVQELCNLAATGIRRVKRRPALMESFTRATGLHF